MLLPFKLVAGLFKGLFGLVFGLLAGSSAWSPAGSGCSVGLIVLFLVLVLLPLAPLLLLGGIVWLAPEGVQSSRPDCLSLLFASPASYGARRGGLPVTQV